MDGTLTAAERTAAEAHASDCAHCQAMLAAMARTAPASPRQAWWTIGSVRWLVPIAAAMVAVAVWVVVNREPFQPQVAKTASTSRPVMEPEAKAPAPVETRAEPQAKIVEEPP